MDDMVKKLIKHCSPTLAGMKTASLFSYSYTHELDLTNSMCLTNHILNSKGIFAVILRINDNTALIYVYRQSALDIDLGKPEVEAFLANCGYHGNSINAYISVLKNRLSNSADFPHEIGLFLGYPLHDVLGFIANKGQNSKYSGYWKVYDKETDALKTFARFNKCREIYAKLFSQGSPIERLIIAV